MYVCICVCMHVYVCMYICVCVCMYVFRYVLYVNIMYFKPQSSPINCVRSLAEAHASIRLHAEDNYKHKIHNNTNNTDVFEHISAHIDFNADSSDHQLCACALCHELTKTSA
jgi:hypothetical protein